MRYGAFVTIAVMSLVLLSASYADNPSTPENNGATMQATQNKGEAFLAQNKTQPGVITLPDGLQYKVIQDGSGPKPSGNDIVSVHYSGTLIDGTEFDSSYRRGEPASFPVNGVIPGWTEALKMMRTGSTWMLYIPASLAYGERGAPPVIGPNETLIFKVELLGIEK
jgi:FKBP-type peptidyl-prolyl cis-trans isomerase FklB